MKMWERRETERIRDREKGKKDLIANLSNTKPYIKSFIKPFIETKKKGTRKKLYK